MDHSGHFGHIVGRPFCDTIRRVRPQDRAAATDLANCAPSPRAASAWSATFHRLPCSDLPAPQIGDSLE